jgi:hypothetical protein
MFKKILLMIILVMAMIGCTAEDIAIWKDSDRRMAEKGIRCYENENGYYYCKDKYGNRTY